MDAIENFKAAVKRGDTAAVEFMKWQWTEMILSDIHFRIADLLTDRARAYRIDTHLCKQAINGLYNNAKKLDSFVVKHVSHSKCDDYFGDRAEAIQGIIEDIMFLNKESLIKVHAHIKLVGKKGAFLKGG